MLSLSNLASLRFSSVPGLERKQAIQSQIWHAGLP
jgi:hypothetical protein